MAGEPRDFGPYRLVRRLGVGGMAETFEATRLGAGGFEQRVCLKRVLPAYCGDEEFVARFRREAKLAAQLRHSHIVGVIDFGEIDAIQYMSLELVDGVDLRSLLKSSRGEKLPPDWVALIGTDLAYALEHAHESLVHRDISPSNILLSRSGEAKLADFGIAKALEDTAATASRSAKGKVPYMSPEHMRGEPVDGRSDLFSLGVVLFEAVAGCRPFDGRHDIETMQKVLSGDRLSLERVAPSVPGPLRELIERLIEVDREARTPNASRLIEELAVLAPSPAVRRELAATIEGHRGGPRARLHVRAKEEERDTELSRTPGPRVDGVATRAAAPEKTKPPRKMRAWILSAALLTSLTAMIVGTQWLGSETVTAPESVPASVPVPVPASVPASVPVPAPVPAPVPVPETAPRPSKGWLHVVVQPWGNVWIDGNWMGRAPVKARLPKGRHVVEAGRKRPIQTRIVRVLAGSRKEVEFNLPD